MPGVDRRYNASAACLQVYYQLTAFTLSLADTEFIHQIVVDTYTAQHPGPGMRPITIPFALIGLYLAFERGFTGREVQLAHISLGRKHIRWPEFTPPLVKASVTVLDILPRVSATGYREPIMNWGKAVWETWKPDHKRVGGLVSQYL